jgi:hypothetical protein
MEPVSYAPNLWDSTLHSFNVNGKDGYEPYGELILDTSGNLHGTTFSGGANASGTVFEFVRKPGGGWSEEILLNFNYRSTGGEQPYGGLVFDASGNLYATTFDGGMGTCSGFNVSGCGTVFELSPALHATLAQAVTQDCQSVDPAAA